MRIEQALEKFVQQLQANGRSSHTTAQVTRHVRVFAAWWKGDVESVGHEDVAQFLASSAVRQGADGQPRLASSANALRSSIKGFLRYVHDAGLTQRDCGRLIRRARCPAPRAKALCERDEEALVEAIGKASSKAEQRDRALFLTLLRTGIRIGSALALDVTDVDFDRRQLTLRTQKGGGTDVVFFGDEVAGVLKDAIGSRRLGALFLSSHGARLGVRQARRRLESIARQAGISAISPHVLRHSFATRLAQRTHDLFLVARALNHRSLGSTLRYAQASDEALRQALAM